MPWIKWIAYDAAVGRLKAIYDRVRGPDAQVDNILSVQSLRPHTLEGHMTLYKNVLHHSGNTLPRWLMEAIGVYVSMLNGCDYCVRHHVAGMRGAEADSNRADAMQRALESGELGDGFDGRSLAMLRYAGKLTTSPSAVAEDDVRALRDMGWDDGEILEVNQVISYFAYANRTVLGLGVTTYGEARIGLAPTESEQAGNWEHK
jgi:uncharacterized peroxidase-related enzyme